MVERYRYFVEHSEYGRDCAYARKCKDLFLKHDYDAIYAKIKEIVELFNMVEGRPSTGETQ